MAEPSGALQGHFVSRSPSRAGSQVALGTRLNFPSSNSISFPEQTLSFSASTSQNSLFRTASAAGAETLSDALGTRLALTEIRRHFAIFGRTIRRLLKLLAFVLLSGGSFKIDISTRITYVEVIVLKISGQTIAL